jgi:phosphoribosylformylglycinamidine synthase
LIKPEYEQLFKSICNRERLPVAIIGHITGDGRIVVHDSFDDSYPVDLELEKVLGKMPRKVFHSQRIPKQLKEFSLGDQISIKVGIHDV